VVSSRKQVVVALKGGLGNQLFQYAAGRALAYRLDCKLIIDLDWYIGESREYGQYVLSKFNIEENIRQKPKYFPSKLRSLMNKIRYSKYNLEPFVEKDVTYDKNFELINEPRYIDGYWQSEKYFAPIRSILLKEFTLKEKMPDYCQAILNEISNTESVCVHIRRGDYESDQEVASIHGLCSLNYYYKCANEIAKTITSPSFFVFSDDPNWVKQNLNLNFNTIFVDINNHPHNPHYDLSLMMACKYFIIANSTYSWWGAWLSSYKLKKVYAPINWFALNKFNSIDLIPTDWIRR
tara:strand:+ start:333 stop:1211 length:879 start_codon:yes stop_codon:yes gene_type:complete